MLVNTFLSSDQCPLLFHEHFLPFFNKLGKCPVKGSFVHVLEWLRVSLPALPFSDLTGCDQVNNASQLLLKCA